MAAPGGTGAAGADGANGTAASAVTLQVRAPTAFGDSIVLVGSCSAMGRWDPQKSSVRMTTTAEDYPLWTSGPLACPTPTAGAPVEYKYVRVATDGRVEWEADGDNRRLPIELAQHGGQPMVIDDGEFGYVQPESFGFPAGACPRCPGPTTIRAPSASSPRLVIVGDAVAAGHSAWRFEGWAARLSQSLRERYGYVCANLATADTSMKALLDGFKDRVAPLQPSVVVIAAGLELRHLATCPEWDRGNICKQFLASLEGLVEATWELGALPMVGAPYPHANLGKGQAELLWQVRDSLAQWGVPLLDWLGALSAPGRGGDWAAGVSHDPAKPSTEGHRRMHAAISTAVFEPSSVHTRVANAMRELKSGEAHLCFRDGNGFEVEYVAAKLQLVVKNKTRNDYKLNGGWGALVSSLQAAHRDAPWVLRRGLYASGADEDLPGGPICVGLDHSGSIEAEACIPAGCSVTLQHVRTIFQAYTPGASGSRALFYDGTLGVLRTEAGIMIINEADCEYNVHPMWQDVRLATRVLPHGVYEDGSGRPFRTAIVSAHGLQSRVKVPAKGAVRLKRTGPLSSVKQIALLPLGDRCSIRMLLHKVEYDGPCYPFDLTRTTSLADVADMVATGFSDMWNADLLEYDHEAGRVFHKKWNGLSFAHEVEDGDDPVCNFSQVVARMAKRYSGRAARFDYAARHADEVLFLRTGITSRGEVTDMLSRVCARFPGIHASLLLISDQPTEEFQDLLGVTHVREHFDPDRMYEDLDYWVHSAHRFRGILDSHGINAKSLYWCPNNLKDAERELQEWRDAESAKKDEAKQEQAEAQVPMLHNSQVTKFSHSNLYLLECAQGGREKAKCTS